MRYAKPALALVIVLTSALACLNTDVTQPSRDPCTPPVIVAGAGIADFKQRIARQTSISPADSVLDVALTFASAVTASDRDRIGTYNGINVTSGGTAATLRVEFSANDLKSYVASDTGRLTDATIFIPACTTK